MKDDGSTPLRSLLAKISTNEEKTALSCARLLLKTTKDDGSIPFRSLLTEFLPTKKAAYHAPAYLPKHQRTTEALPYGAYRPTSRPTKMLALEEPTGQHLDRRRRRR